MKIFPTKVRISYTDSSRQPSKSSYPLFYNVFFLMKRKLALVILCILTMPVLGGEFVVLKNGFRIQADTHEQAGDKVVLHTKDGSVEIAAATVANIEGEPGAPTVPVGTTVTSPRTVGKKTPQQMVTAAAVRNGLPPELVHSVASVESNYNPKAVSPAGAVGMMQLMPSTAKSFVRNPHDPEQNVEAGARYLRELLLRYEDEPEPVRRALAAYNAGPGAVDKYDGVPPYRETRMYVEKVLQQYWKLRKHPNI